MTEDHEGLQMSKQRPLPPEVPPELEPEWREFERQLDEYITHWGNSVRKMLEAKGYRKVKSQPRRRHRRPRS